MTTVAPFNSYPRVSVYIYPPDFLKVEDKVKMTPAVPCHLYQGILVYSGEMPKGGGEIIPFQRALVNELKRKSTW